MSDRELLEQAISGDRVALHQLLLSHYESLGKRISRNIPARLQKTFDTEDVIQRTFLQVLRNVGRFQPRGEHCFAAWLNTIADNQLKDCIRRVSSERRTAEPEMMSQLVELLSAGSHSPSRSAVRHEAIAAVQTAFDTLPEDYRQAIELRCLAGKSLAETAYIMQRSPRAIQGLVDRGRKKMRAALGSLSLYE